MKDQLTSISMQLKIIPEKFTKLVLLKPIIRIDYGTDSKFNAPISGGA